MILNFFPFVSVPLRGLWFLSGAGRREFIMKTTSFRPLAGIMVLIATDYKIIRVHFHNSFRPLAGIMVLI